MNSFAILVKLSLLASLKILELCGFGRVLLIFVVNFITLLDGDFLWLVVRVRGQEFLLSLLLEEDEHVTEGVHTCTQRSFQGTILRMDLLL